MELADLSALDADPAAFENCSGIVDDEDAATELDKLMQKGCLQPVDSDEEACSMFGAKPVWSKMDMVMKPCNKLRKRVPLDSHQSGVDPATRDAERIVLPRLLDVGKAGCTNGNAQGNPLPRTQAPNP